MGGGEDAREADIGDLRIALLAEQDVGALEVQVDNAVAVQEVHALGDV